MPLLTRYKSAVGAGTMAAFLLVLICGSPWFRDWAAGLDSSTVGGWFAQLLAWPAWSVEADDSIRDNIANVLRAVLVVVFAGVFLYLLGSPPGTVSRLLAGWAAFIFAGAAAALVTAVIRSDPSLLDALATAGVGATYGLFVGWIVGLAALTGRSGSS